MIKINILPEDKIKINKIMESDIDKNLVDSILQLSNELKGNKLLVTASLINTRDKIKDICFLDTKTKLQDCIIKFNFAKKRDIKIAGVEAYKNNFKNMACIYDKLYENFSKRNVAYDILNVLNMKVCPYCNRLYTFTVKKKTRPEFDHFFPKQTYPFLSLSIYNLIPSCGVCNKGKSDGESDFLLYPYEESFEDKGICFEASNIIPFFLKKENIKIVLKSEKANIDIVETYNKMFKIKELYNEHSDYVEDIFLKKYIFNDDACKSIFESYGEFFDSPSEVKQLILGVYKVDNLGQRPLSKLTKDIVNQMETGIL